VWSKKVYVFNSFKELAMKCKLLFFGMIFSVIFAQNYSVEFDASDATSGNVNDYIKLDNLINDQEFIEHNLDYEMTFECFIKPHTYHQSFTNSSFILGGIIERLVIDDNGYLACNIKNQEGDLINLVSNDQLELNQWNHIALTYAGVSISLYINGVYQGSKGSSTSYADMQYLFIDGNDGISIGIACMENGWWYPYDGLIDEIRISNIKRYWDDFEVTNFKFKPDSNTVILYHLDTIINNKIINDSYYGAKYDADIFSITLNEDSPFQTPIGNGTPEDPYQISDLNELHWIASDTANWSYHYVQTADINAAETKTWNSGLGWPPIGNEYAHFTGDYNGNNFTIDSLFISRDTIDNIGFFGIIEGTVRNLNLSDVDIIGRSHTGGITGVNLGAISYCNSSGLINGFNLVGGLAGFNSAIAKIEYCSSTCTITGVSDNIGGLVGVNSNSSIVSSYATGSVSGNNQVGGLVGWNYKYSSIE